MIVFWRYDRFDPNTSGLGFGMVVQILHDSGQADEVLVNLTNADTDEDIAQACEAAVIERTEAEFPHLDITVNRRIP
jgi:hypothetical protein